MTERAHPMALLAALLLAVAATAHAQVPYISGGVGTDERAELAAKEKEYNLKIVTAETSGDFLGEVQVVIESARKQPILEAAMDGPIMLVKLPPGTYTIKATSGRDQVTQTVSVPAQGLREVNLRWSTSRKPQ